MPPREDDARGQVVVDVPPERSPDHEPPGASPVHAARRFAPLRSPVAMAIVACVALAALSAAVLPTVPSYDPWAWIVWGREIVDPHLSFATSGGPSWKPLPVIFTTVFALFGGAAPTLWVITARAGGLLALVGAWRLAARLAGRFGRLAAWIAGVVAVLGVAFTQDFIYYMFRGTSEPIVLATAVWSIDRLLERRHAQAFLVMVAGGLLRPEWWPFLGLYGLWLWFSEPRLRALVVAGFAAQPFFWFVPPWIGSGQPFLAAIHAQEYNGDLGAHPVLTALRRAIDLPTVPVVIAAAVAVVWTAVRERDRIVLALGAAAAVWIAVVVAMVIDGYPGLERFFLPAAAVICVLAGVGVARAAVVVGGRVAAAVARQGRAAQAAALAVAGVLIATAIPFASGRVATARAQKPTAEQAVKILDQLSAAVKAVGGHHGVYPCHSSFAAVNHSAQTALAWKLHVTLGRVGTAMRHPGLDFVGPHNSIDGGPAPVSRGLTGGQLVARVGAWRVLRYTRPGQASDPCVGG
jgi:hypothetical protein